MNDQKAPKQPTDHLPPEDEREPGDERSTAHGYPDSTSPHDPERQGGGAVEEATAAEPTKPARHGVDKLPPGPH